MVTETPRHHPLPIFTRWHPEQWAAGAAIIALAIASTVLFYYAP